LTTYTFYAILQLVSHQLPGRDIQALSQAIRGCIPDGSGERLHGMQEVTGSIPVISTNEERSEHEVTIQMVGNVFVLFCEIPSV